MNHRPRCLDPWQNFLLLLAILYPPNGVVADQVIEKNLEIARQTGAIKNRVALPLVVDFQFVKEAQNELSGKKP